MRLSAAMADVFIEAWKLNCKFGEIDRSLFENEKDFYFPWNSSVRVLVADRTKLANNYLWDGQFNAAKRALMRYGMPNTSAGRSLAFKREISVAYKDAKIPTYLGGRRLSGKVSVPNHDWKYVK